MSKRLVTILLVILFIGGILCVAEQAFAKQGPPSAGDIMGQGKYPQDPHRTFRYVRFVPQVGQNAATATFDAGLSQDSIVIWDTTSDDGVTVTTTATSGDNRVAGIVVVDIQTPEVLSQTATQDAYKRNWGWLQTYGLCKARIGSGGGLVAGDAIGTSAIGGACAGYNPTANFTGTLTAQNSYGACGVAIQASALSTTSDVMLRCE